MCSYIIGGKILTRKISYERALKRIIMNIFNGKCDDKYRNCFFISNKTSVISLKLKYGIITIRI